MPPNLLQNVDIPPIAPKIDGKGVAKLMGIGLFNSSPLSDSVDQSPQPVPGERPVD